MSAEHPQYPVFQQEELPGGVIESMLDGQVGTSKVSAPEKPMEAQRTLRFGGSDADFGHSLSVMPSDLR